MRTRFPLALLASALLGGCAGEAPARPPAAEFLVSAGDSTYWVRPAGSVLRMRGSPILVARLDGRFHEVYVTDDERAYEDATFIGQRVWRRDLVRGDSVLVFEDTLAPAIARRWVGENAGARLLAPGDPHPEDPVASVIVEVSVVAVHGAYLSLEYHADVESESDRPWHTTRRSVVDLRSGRPVSVGELFGAAAARQAIRDGRRSYLDAVDSIANSADARAAALAMSLGAFSFDPASFTIGGDAGSPTVAFFVPGRGEGEAGDLAIPLPELPVAAPPWWADVRLGLPLAEVEGPGEHWEHGGYAVNAEYDADGVGLTLRDAGDRTWSIGRVQAPVHHILWLDAPPLDSASRRGLRRAFDDAVFYDETMQTASYGPRRQRRPRCTAAWRAGTPRA